MKETLLAGLTRLEISLPEERAESQPKLAFDRKETPEEPADPEEPTEP